jgi:GNAT superfamily N-acetyltransferase
VVFVVVSGLAGGADLPAALEVWRLANVARGKVPGERRVAEVAAKLADRNAVVVVAVDAGVTVGMAVGVPALAQDGVGAPVAGLCHVAMVFVHPDRWGEGIGGCLLGELDVQVVARGYRRVQLWTGVANVRARRLYARHGFVVTGRTVLHEGEPILQLAADLPLRVGR